MRWMEIAWEQEGVGAEEIGGPAAHKSVIAYFHQIGRPDISSDEVPWCMAFYVWCLQKAGIDVSVIPAQNRLLAVYATQLGTIIDRPRVGCGVVMKRRDRAGKVIGHHVGFVTKWTAGTVTVLGGNQANAVNERDFKRTDDMVFVWPEPPKTPDQVAEEGSRIAATARDVQKDAIKVPGAGTVAETFGLPPEQLPGFETIAQSAGVFKGVVEGLHSFLLFGWSKVWWIALALMAYWVVRVLWNSGRIRFWRAQDASTGKTQRPEPEPELQPELFPADVLAPNEEVSAHG